jgi:hypothetical protein
MSKREKSFHRNAIEGLRKAPRQVVSRAKLADHSDQVSRMQPFTLLTTSSVISLIPWADAACAATS